MRIEIDFEKIAFKTFDFAKTFSKKLITQLLALQKQAMTLQLPWMGRRVALSKYLIGAETLFILLCFPLTFFLMYGTDIVELPWDEFWLTYALYSLCALSLQGIQIYLRGLWTFNATQSSLRILSYSSALTFVFAPLYFLVGQEHDFTGEGLILNWVVLNLVLSAVHFGFEFLETNFKSRVTVTKALAQLKNKGVQRQKSVHLNMTKCEGWTGLR